MSRGTPAGLHPQHGGTSKPFALPSSVGTSGSDFEQCMVLMPRTFNARSYAWMTLGMRKARLYFIPAMTAATIGGRPCRARAPWIARFHLEHRHGEVVDRPYPAEP
jgi:hypothetical protein